MEATGATNGANVLGQSPPFNDSYNSAFRTFKPGHSPVQRPVPFPRLTFESWAVKNLGFNIFANPPSPPENYGVPSTHPNLYGQSPPQQAPASSNMYSPPANYNQFLTNNLNAMISPPAQQHPLYQNNSSSHHVNGSPFGSAYLPLHPAYYARDLDFRYQWNSLQQQQQLQHQQQQQQQEQSQQQQYRNPEVNDLPTTALSEGSSTEENDLSGNLVISDDSPIDVEAEDEDAFNPVIVKITGSSGTNDKNDHETATSSEIPATNTTHTTVEEEDKEEYDRVKGNVLEIISILEAEDDEVNNENSRTQVEVNHVKPPRSQEVSMENMEWDDRTIVADNSNPATIEASPKKNECEVITTPTALLPSYTPIKGEELASRSSPVAVENGEPEQDKLRETGGIVATSTSQCSFSSYIDNQLASCDNNNSIKELMEGKQVANRSPKHLNKPTISSTVINNQSGENKKTMEKKQEDNVAGIKRGPDLPGYQLQLHSKEPVNGSSSAVEKQKEAEMRQSPIKLVIKKHRGSLTSSFATSRSFEPVSGKHRLPAIVTRPTSSKPFSLPFLTPTRKL